MSDLVGNLEDQFCSCRGSYMNINAVIFDNMVAIGLISFSLSFLIYACIPILISLKVRQIDEMRQMCPGA